MTTKPLWSPKQAWSISRSNARLNLWDGSVRSGKTHASLWRWIRFVSTAPPGELLMIGKTERTLKRNILDPLAEIVGSHRFRLVSGSGECWLFGRRIYIAGANDERSEGKIRGLTLAGAYGDEVTLWPESFFTMLLSRLSVPGAKLFGTMNPDTPNHWLKTRFIDRADELGIARYHFTLDDNPVLDPDYVSALKREYTGLWYLRYIDGLWVIAEGAVYDMFNPEEHVVDILPSNLEPQFVAVDYGTANPTVYLVGAFHGETLYIMREWFYDSRSKGKQMTDAQFSKAFQEWIEWPLRLQSIDVDPSAASFKAQLLHDGVRPVRGANNDVLDGIRVVGRALQSGNLVIHRSCERLIGEMSSYTWDPDAQKRGEDKPMKINDHAVDALRYMAMRALGKRGLPSLPKPEAA